MAQWLRCWIKDWEVLGSIPPQGKMAQGRSPPKMSGHRLNGKVVTTQPSVTLSRVRLWGAPRDMTLIRGGLYSVGPQVLSHGRAQVTLG